MQIRWLAVALFLLGTFAGRADSLPSRDPRVVIPLLQRWHEHDGFNRLEHILGKPDADVGSGLYIWTFRLSDGTSIYASAAQYDRMMSIARRGPGNLAQQLYRPDVNNLDHPLPSSAPF